MSTDRPSPAVATSGKTGIRRYVRDVWAVGDQALISGSNFVTMVLVAHGIGDPAEFGRFTLVYSALLFANILQVALVTQPHNVLGTARHADEYRAYTTSSLLCQLILIAVEIMLAAQAAWFAYHEGWSGVALLISLIPAIAGWQLQEFVRRVLYTEGRHFDVFLNDLISYGGQTVVIGALYLLDRRHFRGSDEWMTGITAMYALTATSALAAGIGFLQIRRSLTHHVNLSALRLNWNYGKWLAGSEILTWCSSIHMYLYLAAAWIGPFATGELKAAQVLFGPTRVIAYYLDTVLPIRFARKLVNGGRTAVNAQLREVLLKVVIPLTVFCATIALFAKPLLRFTFGRHYTGAATILMLYSGYALLTYLQLIITAALRARHATHVIFLGAVCGLLVALPTSFLLMPALQTAGIIIAMIAGVLAATIIYLAACFRSVGPELPGVPAAAGFEVLVPATGKEEPCPN